MPVSRYASGVLRGAPSLYAATRAAERRQPRDDAGRRRHTRYVDIAADAFFFFFSFFFA